MTTTDVRKELAVYNEKTKDWDIWYHAGQAKALRSLKRYTVMLAGRQSGKTVLGSYWLHHEIYGWKDPVSGIMIPARGAGDYLVVTPNFPLLDKAVLPEFTKVFEGQYNLGEYKEGKKTFYSFEKHHGAPMYRIIFVSADNPEALESARANAVWIDEGGQEQFQRQSWEAVQGRTSKTIGRVLITTTIYCLGWLKTELYDKWQAGDPDIEVIQFDSRLNPSFSNEEFERLKQTMPAWRFNMFYRGLYDRPAGLVYSSFDQAHCVVPAADRDIILKPHWRRFVGHDFGQNNTAAVWYAEDPATLDYYVYRTYLHGERSIAQHAHEFKELSEGERIDRRCGGSHQEMGWREGFSMAGWPIAEPNIPKVDSQIERVFALHAQNRIKVFSDMHQYLDEKMKYSYELDDNYNKTTKIERKEDFHIMDAERYVLCSFFADIPGREPGKQDKLAVGVFRGR